jgi:DNA-directed RNA polymerase specialized sigma24 family protein
VALALLSNRVMTSSPLVPVPLRGPTDTTRWQLTTESFDALLSRLASDSGPVASSYERLHRRLAAFFDRQGCIDPDACADATLDRVARQLGEGRVIQNVCRYAYGVARLIVLETIRQRARLQAALTQVPRLPPVEVGQDPRLVRLETRLERLCPDLRSLLVEYYGTDDGSRRARRKRLAARLGISYGALRARVHRARTQLGRSMTT